MDEYFVQGEEPVENNYDEQFENNRHMNSSDLHGVQSVTFDIDIEGLTPEELQSKHKNGFIWKPTAEQLKELRHNLAETNRKNAKDEDRAGSIKSALFLGASVLGQHNPDGPYKLGFDVYGLVGRNMAGGTTYAWTVPAKCPFVDMNKSIFEPDNIFKRWMYENNQTCNMKLIDQHINLHADPNKEFCSMDTSGIGWSTLQAKMQEGIFPEHEEEIYAKNEHIFQNPQGHFLAIVPYAVGEAIKDYVKEPYLKSKNSLVDFEKFNVKITRADRKPWNHISGLAKLSMTSDNDDVQFEQDTILGTPIDAGMKLKIDYVLLDNE